jgi:hypothetical protein
MHKTSALAMVLLLSAAWLQAQTGFPSQDAAQTPGGTPGLTTIEGCLKYDNGQYTLTDNIGTPHRLAGATKKLKPYIDHQIELSGKPSSRTVDNTPPGGASSVIQQYVFEVKSVKQIADACKAY